jgi:sigma-B regulation protein RsbU (phosphoserine phosphatase)
MSNDNFDLLIDNLEFEETVEEISHHENRTFEKIDYNEYIQDFFDKISTSIDIESTINIILDVISDYFNPTCAVVFDKNLQVIMDRGYNDETRKYVRILEDENILDWVKREKKQTIYKLESKNFIVVPILEETEFEGYFFIELDNIEITPKFINLIKISSDILAIFFSKRKIYNELVKKTDNLEIQIDETQSLYDELLIIYEYVKNVSTIFDEKDLFKMLNTMAIRAFDVNICYIFKFDRLDHHLEVVGSTDEQRVGRRYPVSDFFKKIENNEEVIYEKDTSSDFLRKKLSYNSTFVAPIVFEDKIYAYIVLSERKTNKPYSEQDEKILSSLAKQTGFSLQNIKLYGEYVEKQKIERDLELARNIQKSLLPDRPPVIDNMEIVAISNPAKQVGGDYYDFYQSDNENFWAVLGDVSGKGIAASILMSMVRSLLRAEIRNASEKTGELLTNLNNLIASDIYEGKFITFVTCYFDMINSKIYFSNAGHLPTIIYKKKLNKLVSYEADGLPIGILEDVKYDTRSETFEEGDIIVFYTDGINEAMDVDKEEFSIEKLEEIILREKDKSAPAILKIILDEVNEFVGDAPQHDDTTLIVLKKSTKEFNSFSDDFEMESSIEAVNKVVDKIVDFLERLNIVEDEIFDVKLSLSELLINAAKHGNKFDNNKKVYVKYFLSREKLEMEIEDEGEGFKQNLMADYDTRLLEENGRGIILVSSIVDKLKYNRNGNKVEILKYFRGISL